MNRDDYRIRTGDELMYIVITLKNKSGMYRIDQ